MEDIREIEKQTQESLKRKMAGFQEMDEDENEANHAIESSADSLTRVAERGLATPDSEATIGSQAQNRSNQDASNSSSNLVSPGSGTNRSEAASVVNSIRVSVSDMSDQTDGCIASTSSYGVLISESGMGGNLGVQQHHQKSALQGKRSNSKSALNSPGSNSSKSLELIASWRVETLMTADSGSDTDDEFFDAVVGKSSEINNSSILVSSVSVIWIFMHCRARCRRKVTH